MAQYMFLLHRSATSGKVTGRPPHRVRSLRGATPRVQKLYERHSLNPGYPSMVENDPGVKLVSIKVSALRTVQMLYIAYLLLTLASPRWVYSNEA